MGFLLLIFLLSMQGQGIVVCLLYGRDILGKLLGQVNL